MVTAVSLPRGSEAVSANRKSSGRVTCGGLKAACGCCWSTSSPSIGVVHWTGGHEPVPHS